MSEYSDKNIFYIELPRKLFGLAGLEAEFKKVDIDIFKKNIKKKKSLKNRRKRK